MASPTLNITVRTVGLRRLALALRMLAVLHAAAPRLAGRTWHIRARTGRLRRGEFTMRLLLRRGKGPAGVCHIAIDMGERPRRAWRLSKRRF